MHPENNVDYSFLLKQKPMNILAVEDDMLSMEFLKAQITDLGHNIFTASDGQQAIDILETEHSYIDVIMMDREMPVMDGLTAVRQIKDNFALRHIPIIMVTSADSTDEMKQGLDAGVFYYLTKPVEGDMLRSVLSAAVREVQQAKTLAEELGKHKASFDLIDTARFKFKTINQAESLSAFIANCFPEPERVLSGLGELLINAVEHGNLGIGYEKKTDLVNNGTWRAEVKRLQTMPQHEHKQAIATIAHKDNGTYVVIEDQGEGFDWKKYMKIDPSRAGDNHGRGIAQANSVSFDKLTYNAKGNQAIAFVGKQKQIEW